VIALVIHFLVQTFMDATSTVALATTGSVQHVSLMIGITEDVGAPSCSHYDVCLQVGDLDRVCSDPEPCE
jgi:hypothetical protein